MSSTLAKIDKSTRIPVVSSGDTSTGHLVRAQVFPTHPLSLGLIGFNVFAFLMNLGFDGVLWGNFDKAGILILPTLGILGGFIQSGHEVRDIRKKVTSYLSPNDNEVFVKASKVPSLRLKLAMLFRRPIEDTLLLSESDKYSMTNTQARLVRHKSNYYVEVETLSALKTWDLALESVVPETISKSVFKAAIAREDRKRRQAIWDGRAAEEEMLWIAERQKYSESQKKRIAVDPDYYDDYYISF